MVAHLVRLKLSLLANGLRRSPWQVLGLVIALVYTGGAVLLVLVGLGFLSVADAPLRDDVIVLGGGLLVLGWWVVPLVAFGSDATLDPRRFVTFPIPRRQLVVGLTLAGLVGVPGVMTTLVALGTAGAWWRSPVAVVVGLVGAVLGLLTCVVGSRAVTTGLASLVGGRRFREVTAVVLLLPLFFLGPILNGLLSGVGALEDVLPTIGRVAGWTPFGAAWALAGDAARGDWLLLLARLVLAAAVVGLLALLWDRGLRRVLTAPAGRGVARNRPSGLGAFGRLPVGGTGAAGAVAARSLTYWVRDPRYAAAVVLVPLLPFLMWFIGGLHGGWMLAVGPVAGFLMAWTVSADVSYDGTAFWTHLAAPVRGRDDRMGRVVAALIIGVPTTLTMAVISLAVSGRWQAALPVLALSLATLGTTLGAATALSVRVVVPVAKPGDSPFSSPQGGNIASMVVQIGGWLLVMALMLPAVGLTVAAVVTGAAVLAVLAPVVGLGLAVVYLLVGIRIGARTYDRRAPELLQQLVAMP